MTPRRNSRAGLAGIGMPAAVAVLATVGLAFAGVELPFAIAWALLIAVIVIVRRAEPPVDPPGWPPAHHPTVTPRGSEVSRLAWSFVGRTGVAGPTIVRRVRNLVRRRLAHRGIDIDDVAQHDAADMLLGDGVCAALFHHHVTRSDIERALDAIELLSLTAGSAGSAAAQHPDSDDPPTDRTAKDNR